MKLKNFKDTISVLIILSILISLSNYSYAQDLKEININKVNYEAKSINDVDENLELGDYIILDEYIPFSAIDNIESNNEIDIKGEISPNYIFTNSLGLMLILLGVNHVL